MKHLIPDYTMIKFPSTCPASKFTQNKVSTLRIKDEIRYPYTEKQQLKQLQHLPLTLANSCNNLWLYIEHTIEEKLRR